MSRSELGHESYCEKAQNKVTVWKVDNLMYELY